MGLIKYELYDYQDKAVNNIRSYFRKGFEAPLLVLPTGGGKTIVFSYITQSAASKGNKVLILVHRIELLRQTKEKLENIGVPHGLINRKYMPDYSKPTQVASVQTLIKRLDKIDSPDVIIIDESHHATAGSWRKVCEYFPNAKVLGVTATPIRSDGKGLGIEYGGIFDSMIIGAQPNDLIERGFLVRPIVYAPNKKIDLSEVQMKRGDYDRKQLSDLLDKPTITGNAVREYSRICPFTPAVAFCVSVAHAKHVAAEFRNAGFSAEHVDGSMDDDVRTRILDGLANGSIHVVCSCDIISEGTDIPAIGCAILLRPTKSLGLYLQQVGRAMRTLEGKSKTFVLDHANNVFTHGFPDDDREWSLEGKKKKKRGKRDQEKDILVSQCEDCYAVHPPAPVCPHCGYVYPIKSREVKHEEGDLVMISPEQEYQQKIDRKTEIANAQTLADLTRIQKKYGYKNGWAYHLYKARQKKLINSK